MPIYEYRCSNCGHQFEVMHAVNAAAPKCERCGRAVRRVFTPVGIIFKGSGWHITDYRKTPAPVDGEAKKTDGASGTATEKASGDGKGDAASGGAKAGRGAKSGGAGSKAASRSGGGTATS